MARSRAQADAYARQAERSPAHPLPAERADSNQAVVFKAVSPLAEVTLPPAAAPVPSSHKYPVIDAPTRTSVAAAAAAADFTVPPPPPPPRVTAEMVAAVQPARVVMTLDHDYDDMCRRGKNRYTEELRADLAAALRIPQGRIEVLELSRGSVKATIALHDAGSGPALLALVRELQLQLTDPGSALKRGKVTSKALAIQSVTLPGLVAGSSRVSEVGEDFMEELDSIHFARNVVEQGPLSTAPSEVNGLAAFAFSFACSMYISF